ncbi:MAG TPA: hypothetical protein VGP17_04855, partial [Solirubrobacteraceae bacterium]|nr:hypothetical protein [Solirubrobacteraceae bacterium]
MSDTDTGTEQTIEEQDQAPAEGGAATGLEGSGGPESSSLGGDDDGGPGEVLQGEVLEDEAGDDAAELEGDLDELAVLAGERDQYLALAQRT